MNGNIIMALIVVLAAVFAIRGILRMAKGKGGCCGCPGNKECTDEDNSCDT